MFWKNSGMQIVGKSDYGMLSRVSLDRNAKLIGRCIGIIELCFTKLLLKSELFGCSHCITDDVFIRTVYVVAFFNSVKSSINRSDSLALFNSLCPSAC